jgi:pyruvate dehydrogenase E1 component
LSGEGLQHEDGQSQIYATTIPTCRAYDPAFSYEVAVIAEDGVRRMMSDNENAYYYITLYNENYVHPSMPAGAEEGIRRGIYLLRPAALDHKQRVQLIGSGSILRLVLAAADLLEARFDVAVDVWSATSFGELRKDGIACDRWNLLHPAETPRTPYVTKQLGSRQGPVVGVSDFIRAYPDLIRNWVPWRYTVLGTDGFGRSDTRVALRDFFEIDERYIALAALKSLADEGAIGRDVLVQAMAQLEIAADKPTPLGY